MAPLTRKQRSLQDGCAFCRLCTDFYVELTNYTCVRRTFDKVHVHPEKKISRSRKSPVNHPTTKWWLRAKQGPQVKANTATSILVLELTDNSKSHQVMTAYTRRIVIQQEYLIVITERPSAIDIPYIHNLGSARICRSAANC